ncbi:acetyl esterase/lipase [Nakamurella sp. UYEF19]|uniref:alpha/beta hydrolase n=1 Tax=Nakamurella sp. UYEF19 TaxID=1756392 RepID=UPI0033929E44
MVMDPAVVRLFEKIAFEHISDVGIERFRAEYLARTARAPSPIVLPSVVDRRVPDGPKLRVYRPEVPESAAGSVGGSARGSVGGSASREELLPLVVFFHGGGWTVGNLDTHDHIAREIAVQVGAVVVAVDYRLAPEHPYPAAVDDAWAALRWAVAQASELGVDPTRVAVAGDSAGGNLAAAVAQLARDAGGPLLKFQLLWYPATSLDPDLPSMAENSTAPILSLLDMQLFQAAYTGDADPATLPATYLPARAADLHDLPPAYIATATFDPLRDDGAAYAELLRRNGVSVELQNHDGLTHGFVGYVQWVPAAAAALARSLMAIRAVLVEPTVTSVLRSPRCCAVLGDAQCSVTRSAG